MAPRKLSLAALSDFFRVPVRRSAPIGSFASFCQARQKEGADLTDLKPLRMNPSDAVLQLLMTVQTEKEAGP